ncbi:MAG: hypothetical protein ACPLSY_05000 [Moorellaceae bacterium]
MVSFVVLILMFTALLVASVSYIRASILAEKWTRALVLLHSPRVRVKPHRSIFGEVESIEVEGRLNVSNELKGLGEVVEGLLTTSGSSVAKWVPDPEMKLERAAICPNGRDEVWTYYCLTLPDGTEKLLRLRERLPLREALLEEAKN